MASEVALALVVLSGAGLMIKSMTRLLGVDPGLNPKNVLTMEMSVPQEEIYVRPSGPAALLPGSERARRRDSRRCVGRRCRLICLSKETPAAASRSRARRRPIPVRCPAQATAWPARIISRPWGFRSLKGREFTPQDTVTSPGVIVINETMAHDYWPKEDPIGRAIRLGGSNGPRLTVVGVVGDVHFLGLDAPIAPAVFPALHAGRMADHERRRPHHQHARHVHAVR